MGKPESCQSYRKASVVRKVSKSGVSYVSSEWLESELEILRSEYPVKGYKIPELLKRHTKSSIRGKAFALGLRYERFWSEDDKALLREKYPIVGADIPELLSKFTRIQIQEKAFNLNVTTRTRQDAWSEEDDALLRAKYPTCGSNIPELLSSRTVNAIRIRAGRLGLNAPGIDWTPEDLAAIKQDYPVLGANIPELRSKYTAAQITKKAQHLGVRFKDAEKAWTRDELQIIRERYATSSTEELAEKLPGRTPAMIRRKAHRQGERKATVRSDAVFNSEIFSARSLGNGWYYVICQTCGRVFLKSGSEVAKFSHNSEGIAVPEGWRFPYGIRCVLDKYRQSCEEVAE